VPKQIGFYCTFTTFTIDISTRLEYNIIIEYTITNNIAVLTVTVYSFRVS